MRTAIVFLMLFAVGAHANSVAEPNPGSILRLISRFGVAHGCPISPDMAITNAHVVDVRPFDPGVPLFDARYESVSGSTGLAYAAVASGAEDLATIVLDPPVVSYYPVAQTGPIPGDQVYWMSYDFRKPKTAFAPRYLTGKVTSTIAGSIIINSDSPEGSSGSCVLNAKGEVVGIVAWGKGIGTFDDDTVTIAVGVYPPWDRQVAKLVVKAKELKALKEAVEKPVDTRATPDVQSQS